MAEPTPDMPPSEEEASEPQTEESRWRRYEAMVRARVDSATAAAEARRGHSVIVDAGYLILDRNRLFPLSLLVGALASRIVIYQVPLFALIIFGFGLYNDGGTSAAEQAGMPALMASAVGDASSLADGFRVAAFLATLWATLYAANSLGRLVRRISSIVWGVPFGKVERAWVLPLTVIGLTLVGWALTETSAVVDDWNFQLLIGVLVAEGLTLTVFWIVVSRMLPHDPEAKRWADFLPGALFVAFGVVGLRIAMVVYFAPNLEQLSDRYGSVAIALVLLTWAYWLGMIMAGSAELNAALFQSRKLHAARAKR